MVYTDGTVGATKIAWKSFALSGLTGAKWFCQNYTTGEVYIGLSF